MEIEGTIEAISYKTKGIKVNGKWFNISEDFLKNLQKGQKVKLTLDEFGNIKNIEILGFEESIDKDIKIEALKSSIELLKLIFQYGQPYELEPAIQQRSLEGEAERFIKLLEKIYRKILNLVK